jgi:DNA-binding NarL/FixJ family response regulator
MDGTELSPREIEVAALVHQGLSNKEVAARLYLGETTIKTHLHRIFARLGVASRVGVALWYERRKVSAGSEES